MPSVRMELSLVSLPCEPDGVAALLDRPSVLLVKQPMKAITLSRAAIAIVQSQVEYRPVEASIESCSVELHRS